MNNIKPYLIVRFFLLFCDIIKRLEEKLCKMY